MSEEIENFHLARNGFDAWTKNTFKGLLTDGQAFTDVTLACSEDKQIEAHKVILSACSPFFRSVLIKNTHQHPLIYLKGVSSNDLEAIVAFIYQGETSVSEDQLDSFLSSAQDLQVEGLRLAGQANRESPVVEADNISARLESQLLKLQTQPAPPGPPARTPTNPSTNPPTPVKDPLEETVAQNSDGRFQCPKCEFTSTYRKSITRHLQSKNTHPEGGQAGALALQSLDVSDSVFNKFESGEAEEAADDMVLGQSASNLEEEVMDEAPLQPKVEVVKEQCDQCDFSTAHRKNLRRHVQRLHGSKEQNSFSSSFPQIKQENIVEEKMEESRALNEPSTASEPPSTPEPATVAAAEPATVNYSCDKCETTSKNKWDMSRHILRIHKEMRYLCDHCDFKAAQTHRLREHVIKKH